MERMDEEEEKMEKKDEEEDEGEGKDIMSLLFNYDLYEALQIVFLRCLLEQQLNFVTTIIVTLFHELNPFSYSISFFVIW